MQVLHIFQITIEILKVSIFEFQLINGFIQLFISSLTHLWTLLFWIIRWSSHRWTIIRKWIWVTLHFQILQFSWHLFDESLSKWGSFNQIALNLFVQLYLKLQALEFLLEFFNAMELYGDIFGLKFDLIFILLILDDQNSFLLFIRESFQISIRIFNDLFLVFLYSFINSIVSF